MGTRGTYGFYKGGVSKLTYNHWDSYPTGLGLVVCEAIQNYSNAVMHEAFDRIRMVKQGSKPTKKDVKLCQEYINLDVSEGNIDDWYCLLRQAQGTLDPWLRGKLPVMLDSEDFMGDSLMCEWAYVINLDEETVEIYQGFQKEPSDNRYSKWVEVRDKKLNIDNYFTDLETGEKYRYYEVALNQPIPFEVIRKMSHLELKDELITIEENVRDGEE